MESTILLLGVDGGGTRCRARLATAAGRVLGEGAGGPANVRFGLEETFGAIRRAAAVVTSDAHAACLGAHGGKDGGLAEAIAPWVADETRRRSKAPRGDALSGALGLARAEACAMRLVA